MVRRPVNRAVAASQSVQAVVAGAASRDLDPAAPRGWRLGGGVCYGALALARLGLRVGALVGVDDDAARAAELDLLRQAGVDVVTAPLGRGPVYAFEHPAAGRRLRSAGPPDPVPTAAVPVAWRSAPAWLLAPVAGELPDDWASVPPATGLVGLGWQGLLRTVGSGGWLERRIPARSPLLARADLVGVSREDLDPATDLWRLLGLLRPGATLAMTDGPSGGLLATLPGPASPPDARPVVRRFPAIPAREVDSTGAGDVFLAGLLAARLEPRLVGGRTALAWAARLGAAVASLTVEGPGLLGVPERPAIRARLAGRSE